MYGSCGYGCEYENTGNSGYSNTYALILVLFILLVLIGCTCYGGVTKGC